MSLSRKHYVAVAEILKGAHPFQLDDDWDRGYEAAVVNLTDALAELFRRDNSNFDAARFVQAANPVEALR